MLSAEERVSGFRGIGDRLEPKSHSRRCVYKTPGFGDSKFCFPWLCSPYPSGEFFFYSEELLASGGTRKMEDRPLSAFATAYSLEVLRRFIKTVSK